MVIPVGGDKPALRRCGRCFGSSEEAGKEDEDVRLPFSRPSELVEFCRLEAGKDVQAHRGRLCRAGCVATRHLEIDCGHFRRHELIFEIMVDSKVVEPT